MRQSFHVFLVSCIALSFGSVYASGVRASSAKHQVKPVWQNQLYTTTFHPPNYSNVVAKGYFNLKIVHRGGQPWVKTASYGKSLISVSVHDNTLYLLSKPSMFAHYVQHPSVVVNLAHKINNLKVSGPVNLNTKGEQNAPQRFVADGYGSLQLLEVGPMTHLTQTNNNVLRITGIQAKTLEATLSGSGNSELQGQVDNLDLRIEGDAILKARQLAATHVRVQAKHNSIAYLYPLKSIRGFAQQSGKIYYYKSITDNTRYSTDSGNVLQLTHNESQDHTK